jgi:hypothetical protein
MLPFGIPGNNIYLFQYPVSILAGLSVSSNHSKTSWDEKLFGPDGNPAKTMHAIGITQERFFVNGKQTGLSPAASKLSNTIYFQVILE